MFASLLAPSPNPPPPPPSPPIHVEHWCYLTMKMLQLTNVCMAFTFSYILTTPVSMSIQLNVIHYLRCSLLANAYFSVYVHSCVQQKQKKNMEVAHLFWVLTCTLSLFSWCFHPCKSSVLNLDMLVSLIICRARTLATMIWRSIVWVFDCRQDFCQACDVILRLVSISLSPHSFLSFPCPPPPSLPPAPSHTLLLPFTCFHLLVLKAELLLVVLILVQVYV